MILVDSHAHLDYLEKEGHDIEDIIGRANDAGVSWFINPSVPPGQFDKVLAIAEKFDNVFAAAAIHPTDVKNMEDNDWKEKIKKMLLHPKVIALGETGLDYYWDKTFIEKQKEFFSFFLELSREYKMPVIVHDREAHEDIYNLVKQFPGCTGVMHCFSGDKPFAEAMIQLGFYISFAGNLTFKKAFNLHDTARSIPIDRIIIETDSPFLSPAPLRGKTNEPANLRLVAEKLAGLRGVGTDTIAKITSENAQRIFNPCL